MGTFNRFLVGMLTASLCVIAQATSRLELDKYGRVSTDPSVPWGITSTEVFTETDGSFSAKVIYPASPQPADNIFFLSNAGYLGRYINLYFSSGMSGVLLDVGTYLDAERYPFNRPGHPGLDLTNTGAAYSILNGQFQVFELKRDDQGVVTNFAASFEILLPLEFGGFPLSSGRVWFNSDAIISPEPDPETPTVPEPNILVLLATVAASAAVASKRRSRHDAS